MQNLTGMEFESRIFNFPYGISFYNRIKISVETDFRILLWDVESTVIKVKHYASSGFVQFLAIAPSTT